MYAQRGHTLFEVVLAAGLLAICIPLFFNLVPLSLKTLGESERLRICAALAEKTLQESSLQPLRPGLGLNLTRQVEGETFLILREVYAVDAQRLDVIIEVRPPRGRPFQLRSRLPRDSS